MMYRRGGLALPIGGLYHVSVSAVHSSVCPARRDCANEVHSPVRSAEARALRPVSLVVLCCSCMLAGLMRELTRPRAQCELFWYCTLLVSRVQCTELMSRPLRSHRRPLQPASPYSGAEASPAADESEVAHLLERTPSAALCHCQPGVCPWCILQCRHGDLADFLDKFSRRRELLPAECTRGRFILQHCKVWVIDMAEADSVGELEVTTSAEQEDAPPLASAFSIFGGPIGGSARPSSWLSNGPTQAPPPPSHDPPPPPPPPARNSAPFLPLPGWQRALPSAAGAASSTSSGSPWPGPGWYSGIFGWAGLDTWQFWAGARTKWVDYPPEISARLSVMQREGPRWTEYTVNDQTYILDVEKMQQDNPATGRPPRKIRIRPHEIHV